MTVNHDDLPKPERGTTETEIHPVEPLPAENIPNVSALTDGADAGPGSFGGGDSDEGQQEQEEAVVSSEDGESASDQKQS